MDAKGDMTAQDTKTIVEDAQTKAEEINNNPVSEKATPEVKTPGETPAQVQPTPTEASTIASAEAPKEPTVTPTETKTAEPTVEPATVKVSRAQLPVGEGAIKTSGLEARMKASLDNLSEGDKANISNYKEMNNANQLKAAADYVRANPDEAMEVLKGNKPAPKGLLMNAIYLALQESGKGDLDLATKLASLHSTRAGQEIQILRNADPFSPDNYIREIQNSKIESLGRERVKTMMDKELQSNQPKLEQNMRQAKAYTKMTLDDFINHITC
jgi:hypothetical protein